MSSGRNASEAVLPSVTTHRRNDGFAMTLVLVALASSLLAIALADGYGSQVIPLLELALAIVLAAAYLVLSGKSAVGLATRRATLFLIGMFVLSFVQDAITKSAFGHGDPPEIQLTYALRNLMIGFLAVRGRAAMQSATVTSLFLVVYSFLITFSVGTAAVVIAYTFFGLWWLIGAHWSRLRSKFPDSSRTEIPKVASTAAVCLATALLAIIGLALGSDTTTTALAGIFPSSGGSQNSGPFARGGVGGGDQMVRAKDDAASFGPIESELFLESQMPSLYDMYNEFYDEPNKKSSGRQRAIPLSEQGRENHETKARNQKVSREFSAVRKRSNANKQRRKLKDTKSRALLYVLGRVPLHLRVHVYDHWDGESLSCRLPVFGLPLELEVEGTKPWVRWERERSTVCPHVERHQLKFVNLNEHRVPSPPNLSGVHIDRLHTATLFSWCEDGCLRMEGQRIPPLTVLHTESRRATATSRESATLRPDANRAKHATSGVRPALTKIFEQWRDPSLSDWQQLELVCQKIRDSCQLDGNAVIPTDATDAVEHFLLESRRGPDYLFATTAALALRHLGYDARVASGFYARAENFDRTANATAVFDENIHFWTEVKAVDGEWLTVDATPGYSVLLAPRPWYEPALVLLHSSVQFVWRNGVIITVAVMALFVAYRLRVRLVSLVGLVIWRLSPKRDPRALTLRSLKLLQLRARVHGQSRPSSQTIENWLVSYGSPGVFLLLSQWALYAQSSAPPISVSNVEETCRLSLKSITARLQSH